MTCKSCNTPYTCAESALCTPPPSTKQRPATWTDSPRAPQIQSESKEPRWVVYGLVGAVAFVLAVKFFFT